jgi:DNA polymerase-1
MVHCHDYLKSESKETRMLLQVHDELVFEVPYHEAPEVPLALADIMAHFPGHKTFMKVPHVVDIEWSDQSWGHKKAFHPEDRRWAA